MVTYHLQMFQKASVKKNWKILFLQNHMTVITITP